MVGGVLLSLVVWCLRVVCWVLCWLVWVVLLIVMVFTFVCCLWLVWFDCLFGLIVLFALIFGSLYLSICLLLLC